MTTNIKQIQYDSVFSSKHHATEAHNAHMMTRNHVQQAFESWWCSENALRGWLPDKSYWSPQSFETSSKKQLQVELSKNTIESNPAKRPESFLLSIQSLGSQHCCRMSWIQSTIKICKQIPCGPKGTECWAQGVPKDRHSEKPGGNSKILNRSDKMQVAAIDEVLGWAHESTNIPPAPFIYLVQIPCFCLASTFLQNYSSR